MGIFLQYEGSQSGRRTRSAAVPCIRGGGATSAQQLLDNLMQVLLARPPSGNLRPEALGRAFLQRPKPGS